MNDYHIPLLPGNTYHIFSQAVGDEKLFRNRNNYLYFLRKYCEHSLPVSETYCHCLLPDHFDFLVKIRPEGEIRKLFSKIKKSTLWKPEYGPGFVMKRFSNLLNAYAKAYNEMYKRKGALFVDYMRRELVAESQIRELVSYIHNKPLYHGLCRKIEEWPYSSYFAILNEKKIRVNNAELLAWFGGVEQFAHFHELTLPAEIFNRLDRWNR